MFPAEYKDNIFIAEHGSWNRHKYQGGRIERVVVSPDGKHAKQGVFASGWITGEREDHGRPADILQAPDGSLLVADDWAGAIYRISYAKGSRAACGSAFSWRWQRALRCPRCLPTPRLTRQRDRKRPRRAPCHGASGVSAMPGIPSLAGQADQFIQWQLVFFRSGRRSNPVMAPLVANMSDADVPESRRVFLQPAV